MSNYTYNIDEQGAIWFYDGVNHEPFMRQPNWPKGAAWGKGEAKAWADQLILSLTDLTADLPGDDPSAPTKPRPVVEPTI